MRPLFVFSLLLALGCQDPRLAPSQGGVLARETRLEFARTFVGRTRGLTVHLANASAASRPVRLHAEPPFWVPERVEVGPGATREVEVQFRPAAPGSASGSLSLETDGQPASAVALSGPAELAPPCSASGSCLQADLDPDTGACTQSPAGEGQGCASACISGGVCQAGACVGQLKDCDDHDPCTADACDPARGCLHTAAGPACPAPPNPCQVPSCDPAHPCALEPAPDGTACGPSDCLSARVCMAGACVSQPVPEGAACGEPSPCQPRGICEGGVCKQGPVEPLRPRWTVAPPDGGYFIMDVLGDNVGNLYLPVATGSGNALASYSPDGYERFQVAAPFANRGLLLTEGLVVLQAGFASVEARRTSDGSLAWHHDFVPELGPTLADFLVATLAADGHGQLFVAVSETSPTSPQRSHVVALATASGVLLWRSVLPSDVQVLAGDGLGHLFVGIDRYWDHGSSGLPVFRGSIIELDAQGQPLGEWSGYAPFVVLPWEGSAIGQSYPGADNAIRLYQLKADGGLDLSPDGVSLVFGTSVRVSATASAEGVFALGLAENWSPQDFSSPGGPTQLYRLEQTGAGLVPLAQLPHPVADSEPILTQHGTVLVVDRDPGGTQYLDELGLDGSARFDCPLAEPTWGPSLLSRGRWVVVCAPGLCSYDLGDLDLAPTGWPCSGGNAQRTNFAR